MENSDCTKKHISKKLANGIKIIGDAWILCIVGCLADGEFRFNEIQHAIPHMNPATLTNRLKKLEREKIIKRKEETVDKLSVTYALTPKGRAILPLLEEITIFADKFV